ncbi:hypothetical protein LLG90_15625 [Aromatoleum toluclasticum]|nr:hypothetical protein [Aromatoleum toluclasticum]MCC4116785.1 hypothetical protein [Aromatoleum toluclasticum]
MSIGANVADDATNVAHYKLIDAARIHGKVAPPIETGQAISRSYDRH